MTDAATEYASFIREDIKNIVNRLCRQTGQSHSLVFRGLYLRLEQTTGFRVPAEGGLQAVASAGLIEKLHEIATSCKSG